MSEQFELPAPPSLLNPRTGGGHSASTVASGIWFRAGPPQPLGDGFVAVFFGVARSRLLSGCRRRKKDASVWGAVAEEAGRRRSCRPRNQLFLRPPLPGPSPPPARCCASGGTHRGGTEIARPAAPYWLSSLWAEGGPVGSWPRPQRASDGSPRVIPSSTRRRRRAAFARPCLFRSGPASRVQPASGWAARSSASQSGSFSHGRAASLAKPPGGEE